MSHSTANKAEQPQEHGQYLTFVLAGELFAVGLHVVKEIIEYGQITAVPMMPNLIRGVINLRGSVVPVVDLAVRFAQRQSAVTRKTCIVIIETEIDGERQVVGAVVDAVNAVIDIGSQQIEPPPSFGVSVRTDFIEGMAHVDGRVIVILHAPKVLSAEDLSILAQIRNGALAGEQPVAEAVA
jgi:purine-binding chemotaxis protein CheW